MPIPAPQQHRAYTLIRDQDLSACLAYLNELSLPNHLAKAVQDIEQRYQTLRAQTNYQDVAQRQLLELEEAVFLQELEVLLSQKRRSAWVVWWEEHKGTVAAYLPLGILGMVVVIGLVWYFNRPSPLPELTIFVRDAQGAPALAGVAELVITASSHRSFKREIESDGMVDFSNLSPQEFSDSIEVGLVFKEKHLEQKKLWKIVGPSRFLYKGAALTLRIDKTDTWGWIRGQVADRRSGNPLSGAYIQVADCSSAVYYTDSLGNFDFVLPRDCWRENLDIGYQVQAHFAGYQPDVVLGYHPLSSRVLFRLVKE